MKLNIIKPTDKKVIDVQWLDIQTPVGNFVIQDEHAPMILILKENSEITYRLLTGSQIIEKINHGIAHINRSFVTLLLND